MRNPGPRTVRPLRFARVAWLFAYLSAVPALATEILIEHPDSNAARFDGRMRMTDGVLVVIDGASKGYRFSARTGALLSPVPIEDPASGSCTLVSVCSGVGAPFDCCTAPGTGTCCAQHFSEGLASLGSHLLVGNPSTFDGSGGSGVVYDFDVHTGALNRTFTSPSGGLDKRFGQSIAAAGDIIAIGSGQVGSAVVPGAWRRGRVYLFDSASGALLRTLEDPSPSGEAESNVFGFIRPVFVGPFLAVAASTGIDGGQGTGQVYLFDPKTGALVRRLAPPAPFNPPLTDFGSGGLSAVGDTLRALATYWNPVSQQKAVYRIRASTGELLKATLQPSYNDSLGGNLGVLEIRHRFQVGVDLIDPTTGAVVLHRAVFHALFTAAEDGRLAVMSGANGLNGVRGVVHLFPDVFSCGNHVVEPGERCDDGNIDDGDGCDHDCTVTACGNGILTVGETCDDGNTSPGDACAPDCAALCGNGLQEGAEACDDGDLIDGNGCDRNCSPTGCGNGVLTVGETCDDGDLVDGDGCSSACQPEALDVTGTWQLTQSGVGLSDTRFISLTSSGAIVDMGESELCGTRGVEGHLSQVESYSLELPPSPGTSFGTDFVFPNTGHYTEDNVLAEPVGEIVRVVYRARIAGTIEGQNGRAERIAGRLYTGRDMYNAAGNLRGTTGSLFEPYPMIMRRADAPAGAFVSVQPADGAHVSFAADESGTAAAIALTNPTGSLPAGFRVVSSPIINDTGITDVLTTSSPTGAILTCLTYPDVDDDGIVDFTTPPLAEANVRILHSESGVFTDRTLTRDPVTNQVCAQTASLSQFIMGVVPPPSTTTSTSSSTSTSAPPASTTTTTLPPVCTAHPAASCRAAAAKGASVALKATGDPAKNGFVWKWKGSSSVSDFGNPLGGTSFLVCAYAAGTPAMSARIPAAGNCGSKPCWKATGDKGFAYKSPARTPAGILTAKLKAAPSGSSVMTVKGKGASLVLPGLPMTVPVVVQLQASNGTCWTSSFPVAVANTGTSFRGRSD